MKKKKVLIFVVEFLIFFMVILISNTVFASGDFTALVDRFNNKVNDYNSVATQKLSTFITIILNLIRTVGAGISLITVTYIGIKYMVSSADQKADYKKQAVPILIGCALLFSASEIVVIIGNTAMQD